MTLDPRLQAALAALAAAPKVDSDLSPSQRRDALRANVAGRSGTFSTVLAPVADEQDVLVPTEWGGVPVRIYRPRPGRLPALMFLHGGGWWLGNVDECDSLCRRRALGADCVVVSVDYRLAPEHPFPAALDDCYAVGQWLFEHADELDVDVERIAISGASAGGNLAAAVTLQARESGGPAFVAQVLEVPATDLTLRDASIDEFSLGFGLDRADLEECVSFYIGDGDPTRPLVSPLFAELHDLPPALIFTCECDPVRDGGEAYAAKLAAAGVPTNCRRWEGLLHGTGEVDIFLPDIAAQYSADLHAFLRAAFASDADLLAEYLVSK